MKIKIEKQRIIKTSDSDPKTSTDSEIDAIKNTIQSMIKKNRDEPSQQTVQKYETRIACGEDELLSCVEDGWNIVKELRNGKIILRRNKIRTSS